MDTISNVLSCSVTISNHDTLPISEIGLIGVKVGMKCCKGAILTYLESWIIASYY